VEGAWHHSVYELFIELGPSSDARLLRALELLWQHPALDGPYADRAREPRDQPRVDLSGALEFDRGGDWHGVLTLDDGARVACKAWLLRRDNGEYWLSFFVPLGSLFRVWPQAAPFPFVDSDADMAQHVAWQERLEALLVDIAQLVFAELPFEFAVIGHELEVGEDDFERWQRAKGEILDDRYQGLLVARDGELTWNPPTRRGGWILIADGLGNPSTWSELFASPDDDD
jgi:hypothetical protein